MLVADKVALAQRIQAIALSRMHLARHQQGIDNLAIIRNRTRTTLQLPQLMIQKAYIKRSIMDYQRGTTNISQKILCNLPKSRLIFKLRQ